MSARAIRIVWTTPTHRCELWRVDGNLELRLYADNRATALATCRDAEHASTLAQQWLESVPGPTPSRELT